MVLNVGVIPACYAGLSYYYAFGVPAGRGVRLIGEKRISLFG